MSNSLHHRFACLLILAGFSLFCPAFLSASQHAESGTSKPKSPPGQQQAGEPRYLGSMPQSSFPDVPVQGPASSDGESQLSVTKTLGSILIVLALILVFAFSLKRYMPHRFGTGGKRRFIHILENVSLGEKRSLTLVRIDQEHLLLANTPANIFLIKEINLREPVESAEDQHRINRSKGRSSELEGPAADMEPLAGKRPSHATFRDFMALEPSGSNAPGREGIRQVLSRLSQIRKELRTRLGNS
jgi:flagellar biosynthetic protein FliO